MVRQLLELAPGFSCYVAGEEEARFIYKEIFEDHTYDIAELPENAFIIDAGANIGLFSIYMKRKYPSSTILAFEPAPETFGTFSENLDLLKIPGVEKHQSALGSSKTTQTLTFYPDFPGNSTLNPEEKDIQKKMFSEHELMSRMFNNPEEISVPIQRLSHFLHGRADLTSIDLLKVDVEGAELDVLKGLDDEHWVLIRNVVAEWCDLRGGLDELEGLLRSKGFAVKTEPADWAPKEAKMYSVSGVRGASESE